MADSPRHYQDEFTTIPPSPNRQEMELKSVFRQTVQRSRDSPSPAADDDNTSVIAAPVVIRRETRRDLGGLDVACLIVNKMVGTGIFLGPFSVLQATNDKRIAILLWVIGFVYTLLSMTTYLEYARDLPYTGGELVYLDVLFRSRRLPRLAYTLYCAYFVFLYTTSTNAMRFAQEVVMATTRVYSTAEIENEQPVLRLIAITITSVISLLLYFSSAKSQLLNRITALAKLGFLLAVIVAGIVYAAKNPHRGDWKAPTNAPTNWVQGLLTCLFSYHGWENATLVTGEIPRFKDLRNGFISAVCLVSSAYITIAVTLCYAFPWSGPDEVVPQNFMALYFGNSERAQQAAAVLTALSAAGSMISVAYTCVRVEQCIGWSNILPWSLLWRLSSPVRIPWWRLNAIMHRNQPGHRPQTLEIPRGTPQGGVLLGWIVTCLWICISAGFNKYSDAVKYTGGFLVYGHFFASAAVAYGFFMGAFRIPPYFRHDPERHVPTPHWNAGSPSSLLFPRGREWIGHILLGGSLFVLSLVVIVCGLVYPSGRTYFYVIIGILSLTSVYWTVLIYEPVANKIFGAVGLVISQSTHGIDDREDAERACDECSIYEPRQPHRHAQDGYETYNRIGVKDDSEVGRLLMKIFGGPVEQRYHLPVKKLGSAVNVVEDAGSARHSRDDRPS